MRNRIIIFSIIFIIIAGIALFYLTDKNKSRSINPGPNISDNPVYNKYEFNESDKVIYLGTQPLYLPSGVITETMKRDKLFTDELSSLAMKIHYYPFFKGNDVNIFIQRGKLDAGVGGDMPALRLASIFKIIIPAMIQYGPVSIVTREPLLIKNLRRRRIGYAFGSNAHFALLDILSSANLTTADLDLIPLEVTQMPEALHNKEIDAFCAWEPTPETAFQKYSYFADHKKMSSGFLYFTKHFADKNPEAVYLIIASQIRAIRWLKLDRTNLLYACKWAMDAGANLSGEKTILTIKQYADLAQKDILGRHSVSSYHIPEDSLADSGNLYKEFIFLKQISRISSDSKWNLVYDSFDTDMLTEIIQNPGKYRLNEFDYIIETP
ncbi:ABC transporter substrate-binding protein [Desulfobacterales bacterium HSG17]|nr:ABC transporter substrate-binding protein [Desulfobacterales bacterium HSG17]